MPYMVKLKGAEVMTDINKLIMRIPVHIKSGNKCAKL